MNTVALHNHVGTCGHRTIPPSCTVAQVACAAAAAECKERTSMHSVVGVVYLWVAVAGSLLAAGPEVTETMIVSWCSIGAALGGILFVSLFYPDGPVRAVSTTLIAHFTFGVLFGPPAVNYLSAKYGMTAGLINSSAIAGVVSFMATLVFKPAAPVIGRKIVEWIFRFNWSSAVAVFFNFRPHSEVEASAVSKVAKVATEAVQQIQNDSGDMGDINDIMGTPVSPSSSAIKKKGTS